MDEPVIMSPEQFEQLLAAARAPQSPVGLGAMPHGVSTGLPLGVKRTGVGCGPSRREGGGRDINGISVEDFLEMGSPRLALARCYGVPFAPYIVNVRATFPDVDTFDAPGVCSDVKIPQDMIVDTMLSRFTFDNPPLNILQPISDYYYNWQSGLEATLDVTGWPRYSVAPKFTPIATLTDLVSGESHWPKGWLLTLNEQLEMSFHARIQLPMAPATIVCTFRTWTPINCMFAEMTVREAVNALRCDCGIDIGEAYLTRICR